MQTILKALKKQAGKPFRVIDNVPLVEGFDHYSYKRDKPKLKPVANQHVESDQYVEAGMGTSEVSATVRELECIAEECKIVSETMAQEKEEQKEEVTQAAVELAQGVRDYIDSKVDTLVAAMSNIQPAASYEPVGPAASIDPPRLRKTRVKVVERDRDNNILTIEAQEY